MKLLFCITAGLSVLWLARAAPQNLSLNNSTINGFNDLTTAIINETNFTENDGTSSRAADKEESTSEIALSLLESSTSSNVEEKYNVESDIKLKYEEEFPDDSSKLENDTSKSTFTTVDSVNVFINAETTSLKPTENSETLNESEIPITRYVPPLDPIKHMLMMADIKGMGNFHHFVPKVNLKPETTFSEDLTSTTENSASKELETTLYTTLNNNSYIAEIITESPDENVKNFSETTSVASTEGRNYEPTETTVENSSDKTFYAESTEKISPDDSFERNEESKFPLENTTVRDSSEESVEKIIANESSEKFISEPSEVDESETKAPGKTTTKDTIPVSSTVSIKMDELASIESLDSESSTVFSSTSASTTLTEELNLDSKEKDTGYEEKSDAILKSSSVDININETADEVNESVNEGGVTLTTHSGTEESIPVNNFMNTNLLKNHDSFTTDLPVPETEKTITTTTRSTTSSESIAEYDVVSTSTANEIAGSTFITTSTEIPETTSNILAETPKPDPEIEKKNISLDDELEFRAVKFPQNVSKVSYVEADVDDVHDLSVTEENSEHISESETSTSSIFTTIAEILFSSSSTVAPTKFSDLTETESQFETNPTEKLPLETNSDTSTVMFNETSDALKLQSVTPELSSIPPEETTTRKSSETVFLELEPEELLKSNFEKDFVDEKSEESSEIIPKVDSTTSSPLKTETTTEQFIPTSTLSTTFSEIESDDTEIKAIESSDNDAVKHEESFSKQKTPDKLYKDRYVSGNNTNMVEAVQFLHYNDIESSEQCFKLVNAHWNYATNLTEDNKRKQLEQTLQYSLFHKAAWKNATSFAWKRFNDTLLRRWFKSLSVLGNAALPEDKLNEFNKLKAEMKNMYSTAKICTYVSPEDIKKGQILQGKDCNLTLEPDLTRILAKSRDYDELAYVWRAWREAAGKPIREKYLQFIELGNEAARINGFSDIGDMWREAYESETFESDLEELWEQLRPLYENLHAYVRRRLIQQYGADKIKENGPIPAHLLGNMWAQSWVSLLDITQPFPGKPSVDVTPIMQAKNMTPHEMFKISEEFFISLGLKPMPESFWKHSLIEKPKDREIICHASAWDFCNGKDYRIKQCTDITMEDLITVHHEMGHIQYFLQYARQPSVFREGANPGFHEAIGDVLALSVSTPKHLQSIGLLDDIADDPEGDLNFLLYTALDKVSFLPSGYLIDLWRWGLFSGEIKPEEMNTKWWELRLKYQGICPPVKRTDTDFDPGAKFHIPGHVPYIRYFVSFVIQFQFHKVLCDAAGHTGPLYKCDIYRSKEAGQILSQVMELGSSEHWSEAMKIMTGGATNKMDAGPIMEYFEPLLNFLKEQNQNETLGWQSEDPTICP